MVSASVTISLPTGRNLSFLTFGKFSIYTPTVTFPATAIPPMIPVISHGWLELGDDATYGGTDIGTVNFNAEIVSTPPFTGEANWTQLINRVASYPRNSTSTGGSFALDTEQFYNNSSTDIKIASNNPNPRGIVDFFDSPGVSEWTAWTIGITDSFQTYLEFQPTNGFWVPLGVATWGWSAVESGTNLVSSSVNVPMFVNTPIFPVWTNKSHGQGN